MSQSLAAGALSVVLSVQAIAHAARHWRPRGGAHRTADPLPPYAGFHDGPTLATEIGTFATGFVWCPECTGRTVAILHADGSATCDSDGCGTHIPASEEGAA